MFSRMKNEQSELSNYANGLKKKFPEMDDSQSVSDNIQLESHINFHALVKLFTNATRCNGEKLNELLCFDDERRGKSLRRSHQKKRKENENSLET